MNYTLIVTRSNETAGGIEAGEDLAEAKGLADEYATREGVVSAIIVDDDGVEHYVGKTEKQKADLAAIEHWTDAAERAKAAVREMAQEISEGTMHYAEDLPRYTVCSRIRTRAVAVLTARGLVGTYEMALDQLVIAAGNRRTEEAAAWSQIVDDLRRRTYALSAKS